MLREYKQNKPAFTLIELLVVIAIIGLLATLSVVALNNARARARDSRRASDIKQIHTALELYFNANHEYPNNLEDLETALLMNPVPTAPTPADGDCNNSDNIYTYTKIDDKDYVLSYCLGNDTGGLSAGISYASPLYLQEAPGGSSLNSGLVGHWTFNEGSGCIAHDSSGNSNHGNLEPDCPIDSPNWIEKTPPSYALDFNGSSDYIRSGNLNFNINAGDWTASAWYYIDADSITDAHSWETILGVGQEYLHGFHIFANRVCSRAPDGSDYFCNSFGDGINTREWHLITIVHDVNLKKFTTYIDGNEYNSTTYSGTLVSANDRPITSGWRGREYLDNFFKGKIDDVRIYNRALSEEEILALYNQ